MSAMSISSTVTFAYFRFTASSATAPAATAAAAPVPPAAPASSTSSGASQEAQAGSRARRTGVAAAVQQAVGSSQDDTGGLEGAVLDFASALMRALQADGGEQGDGGHCRHRHHHEDDADESGSSRERHHGHGHHHGHGGGYRAMRALGERIEALAQSFSAPAVASSSAGTAGAEALTQAGAAAAGEASDAPAATAEGGDDATASTAASASTAVAVQVHLQVEPRSTPFARFQDRLLEAFRNLREAMKSPPPADEGALRGELGDFLKRLATSLGASEAESLAAPTAPGALLDLAA